MIGGWLDEGSREGRFGLDVEKLGGLKFWNAVTTITEANGDQL